ncbi:MAG: hypothetical protein ABIR96_08060 [Bdellovibrionota bacterium]
MSGWNKHQHRVVGAAWVLLQCLALVAILFTPVWVHPTDSSLSERFKKIQHVESPDGPERRPTSITSSVIPIPNASFRKNLLHLTEWSEDMESDTRQIRFEWALSAEPRDEEWRLSTIERKNEDGGWEDVSLVWNEFGMPIGSVYVELAKGENVFAAQVVSSKTKAKKKILLRVAQKH